MPALITTKEDLVKTIGVIILVLFVIIGGTIGYRYLTSEADNRLAQAEANGHVTATAIANGQATQVANANATATSAAATQQANATSAAQTATAAQATAAFNATATASAVSATATYQAQSAAATATYAYNQSATQIANAQATAAAAQTAAAKTQQAPPPAAVVPTPTTGPAAGVAPITTCPATATVSQQVGQTVTKVTQEPCAFNRRDDPGAVEIICPAQWVCTVHRASDNGVSVVLGTGNKFSARAVTFRPMMGQATCAVLAGETANGRTEGYVPEPVGFTCP